MNKSILISLALIVVIVGTVLLTKHSQVADNTIPPPVTQETSSILGCYVGGTDKDVYTLAIQSQENDTVAGKLAFKNFGKDSSSGAFNGTYSNGVLLGYYAFESEGMDSLMQVAFKKDGDNFIRGYGDVTDSGDRFINPDNLTYDSTSPLNVFKKADCK